MLPNHEDDDAVDPETQRLQASIHYTVSKLIASILAENNADVTPTPQFVHAVTAVVLAQCGSLAVDLDSFSKHGKRSVVSVEDVKLCVRKNQALVAHLADFAVTLKKSKK